MPVDPNNIYADKAHDKTIQAAGWTYGCHSDKTGPGPRGEACHVSGLREQLNRLDHPMNINNRPLGD